MTIKWQQIYDMKTQYWSLLKLNKIWFISGQYTVNVWSFYYGSLRAYKFDSLENTAAITRDSILFFVILHSRPTTTDPPSVTSWLSSVLVSAGLNQSSGANDRAPASPQNKHTTRLDPEHFYFDLDFTNALKIVSKSLYTFLHPFFLSFLLSAYQTPIVRLDLLFVRNLSV